MTRRLGILGALALLLAVLAPAPASAQEPRASLPDVEDEVMCPICGTLLEESQSPQAERERELIRSLIDEGKDKDQIKDALVAEYGPRVLATPSGSGFDLAAWIVPGLLIALAVVGLIVGAIRLAGRSGPRNGPPPLDAADSARLDRDLSSYDV